MALLLPIGLPKWKWYAKMDYSANNLNSLRMYHKLGHIGLSPPAFPITKGLSWPLRQVLKQEKLAELSLFFLQL